MTGRSLLVPLLDQSPTYCNGVELGMLILAPMLASAPRIQGYFRTENEEQIRLCCYRIGYRVEQLRPWRYKGKYTGWVWMILVRDQPVEESAEYLDLCPGNT